MYAVIIGLTLGMAKMVKTKTFKIGIWGMKLVIKYFPGLNQLWYYMIPMVKPTNPSVTSNSYLKDMGHSFIIRYGTRFTEPHPIPNPLPSLLGF